MLIFLFVLFLFVCVIFLPYATRLESKQRKERRGRFEQLLADHEADLSLRRALEEEDLPGEHQRPT